MTAAADTDQAEQTERVGLAPRLLVVGALALLLVAGLRGIEAWPITGWRLFSEPRAANGVGWSVQAVARDGRTTEVAFEDRGIGYRFVGYRLTRAERDGVADEADVCRDLLAVVRGERPDVVELRAVRVDRRLVHERGAWHSVTTSSHVAFRCRDGSGP